MSLVVAVLVILFGAKIRKAKEEENKYINLIMNANNINTPVAASDANKNLKTGDALNFSSYDIPEYKGYHFEAGVGYVRDKKQNRNNWLDPTYPFTPFGISGGSIFDDD